MDLEHPAIPQYDDSAMENLVALSVGGGKHACHIDQNGMYLGDDDFETAPFFVDMDGNARMNNADIRGKISGRDTDTIARAIDQNGNFVSDTLNLGEKKILKDFTFAGYEGALKTGNIDWNRQNGTITEGSGILINSKGIIGAKDGNATFVVDTNGDATFGGELESPNGTLGVITSGDIIGAKIRSAKTGSRTEITQGGVIQTINVANKVRFKIQQEQVVFYDENGVESGYMYGSTNNTIGLNGKLNIGGKITALNGDIGGRLDVSQLYVNGRRIDTNGGSGGMEFVADTGVGIQVAFNGNVYHLKKV